MKKLLVLFCASILLMSCENTETNSPALQANVKSDFFKAFSASATMDSDDLSLTISGLTDNQGIVLFTEWRGQKTYKLGPGAKSYATFTDTEGTFYTTDSEGSSGEITITARSDHRQEIIGEFNFTAIRPGLDTVVVHNGFFYKVPFKYVDPIKD
ncbi:DUF6252 family protein [Ulvibacter antarcticus]|uniref:Uncharacterized protein n=1 Tax=Ulvibacter antarcticus TaxID=442714 RepID=A0A3L9Z7W5_9FLAO|nr:DUF6252 family protein [Ulvibacter antarcticus]RMA66375.1 hypothetical protein BXY75_0797 [Ulvibacter antarcticus]